MVLIGKINWKKIYSQLYNVSSVSELKDGQLGEIVDILWCDRAYIRGTEDDLKELIPVIRKAIRSDKRCIVNYGILMEEGCIDSKEVYEFMIQNTIFMVSQLVFCKVFSFFYTYQVL